MLVSKGPSHLEAPLGEHSSKPHSRDGWQDSVSLQQLPKDSLGSLSCGPSPTAAPSLTSGFPQREAGRRREEEEKRETTASL